MISPCRIHRARNRVDPFPLALLFVTCLLTPVTKAMGQYATGSTSGGAGAGGGRSVPIEITAGVDIGSDDHVIGSNASTSLVGEYRFEIVDYDTAPRDSTIHFALAGLDHRLTEHLMINVLGGESFRSFKDDGDTIDPYLEAKLAYQGSNHSVNWTTSYGVEQPSTATALGSTTIRSGLNVAYDLTSRINSKAGVYYHHNENQGPSGTSSAGSQDALQFTLGLKYTINKHFALHVDYEYTAQSSSGGTSGYSRNRYFGGLTYTY